MKKILKLETDVFTKLINAQIIINSGTRKSFIGATKWIYIYYSAGKRDWEKDPRKEGAKPSDSIEQGEDPCSMEGKKTRPEENVFKDVENLPALLYSIYTIV